MFALTTPELRDAQVFTRMPERFRRTGERSAWADANRGGQPTDSFLEGPVFDALGNLYVTDIPFGRIFRIDAERPVGAGRAVGRRAQRHEVPRTTRELLVTDYRNGLMVCEIASGTVRPYLERRNSERFKGVNDLVFDSRGNLYFTDQGQTGLHDPTGRVYRLRRDGRLDLLLGERAEPERRGAVARRARAVPRRHARQRGVARAAARRRQRRQGRRSSSPPTGRAGPTGWRWTQHGRLVVANPGLGVAWVLNHHAEPRIVVRSTVGASLTNVAFGGPDRSTLYCTESVSGSVLRAPLDTPGLPLHRPPS